MSESTKYSDNDYLEQHQVHELFAHLLTKLAVQQPENPIGFLIKELELPATPHHICVFGPPGSGKSRLCSALAQRLDVTHISTSQLLSTLVCFFLAEQQ
jgi:SpoVK/Ycf46/Vps4 family AAA+-type ATPase